MKKSLSRKQVVIIASVLVVFLLGAYAFWIKEGNYFFDPYNGLVTSIDVQMDEATRALVQQRVATAEASLAAQEESGTEIDTALYVTIAENEKMLGDLVSSRLMYETYLRTNDSSYLVWNSYAKLLELMKDFPAAEDAFKKSLSIVAIEGSYQDYAEFLRTHYPDRIADEKAILDEAFVSFHQTPWLMIALGDWFFKTGECDQGKAHYDVAVSLSPDNAASIERDQAEKLEVCKQPR